ncbi:MAG: hypothetical protein JXA99_10080 [Candidatus Lokiarchaeota archaeon]|nr:hypothetical protein [Candidatus Lokiarchaeota archaeon]
MSEFLGESLYRIGKASHRLGDDLIAIVTFFSSKIYGIRSHKAKYIVRKLKTEVKI